MKKIYYTWQQFEHDVKVIGGSISSGGFKVDKIYGIKRGGSFLAVSLSYLLGKEVCIVDPSFKIQNEENVLIVDDICDSGKTFKNLVPNKKNYRTASIYYNVKQNYVVNYFARKIDRDNEKSWIVFPWEMNT